MDSQLNTEKKPVGWKYKKVQSSLKMQLIDQILELMSIFMKLQQQPLAPDAEAVKPCFCGSDMGDTTSGDWETRKQDGA